jgi:dTDP-4-amino-4,6-dideoxygalactose transaminase
MASSLISSKLHVNIRDVACAARQSSVESGQMKKEISHLAALGGSPVFETPVYVGRPNIGNRERLLDRINDMLDRRWLSNNGPFVQEFERKVAEYLGVRHCIAMCNGTVALEIAIRATGLKGEVIIPSFTFIATAHALQWQEITPVFCDLDPRTHTIDPAQVQRLITPRTTGIIGVHVWGRACDIEALSEIARRRNLTLMFDASHAFGCSYRGRMIGGFGAAEVFSFHATKFFNTFEGGAIVTNDDELAAKIRLMKNFGFRGYDNVEYIGTNGKMTEICAAMGLTGLESLDEFVDSNHRNYSLYKRELASVPGVRMITYPDGERCNYQYVVLEVEEEVTQISRDMLVDALHAENILARRYFYPGCHRMEPYRSFFPHASLLLAETERLARKIVVLPTGTAINEADVAAVCQVIRLITGNGKIVAAALQQRTQPASATV